MLYLLISILAVALFGFAATFYLRKIRQPRDETAAGIATLAAMSWRDFIHLVLDALGRRGMVRVFEHEASRDDSEYILERGDQRWLLSCKHGSAFILGPTAVNELADTVRVHGATGGLLLTQGKIAAAARPIATLQKIELLDGPTLWPEVREVISDSQRAVLHAEAEERARKHTFYAWVIAVVFGIALFLLLPRDDSETTAAETVAPTVAPAVATPVVDPAAVDAQAVATQPAATPAPPAASTARAAPAGSPTQSLDQQRKDIASAIATLPLVDRAIWSTQSTLQVFLLDAETDAMPSICPLLERYPALAASRVQLTPPSDSAAPVRFRQCRAY